MNCNISSHELSRVQITYLIDLCSHKLFWSYKLVIGSYWNVCTRYQYRQQSRVFVWVNCKSTRLFYRNVVLWSGGLFCCKIKNGITSWVFHLPKHFGCGPISTYRSERQVSQGRNYHRKGSSDKSKRRWNWVGWLWIGVLRTQLVQFFSEILFAF